MRVDRSMLALGAFALVAGITSFAATSTAALAETCTGTASIHTLSTCPNSGPPGPALQTIGQLQHNGGQWIDHSGGNHADTNGSAFEYVTGNAGNNVAGGNANQQTNEAYIEYGGADEDILAVAPQTNGFNAIGHSGNNSAGTGGNAFAWATGNVGSNTAAGNANQQSNDAVLLNGNLLVGLTMGTFQQTGLSGYWHDGGNTATVGGSSFSHAIGNIGNNVAAGNGNQQSNQLVVNNLGSVNLSPQAGTGSGSTVGTESL